MPSLYTVLLLHCATVCNCSYASWHAILQGSVLSNSGNGNSASNSSSTGMKPAGASKKRRWYLGIQSKKEAAHVMTEVYRAVSVFCYIVLCGVCSDGVQLPCALFVASSAASLRTTGVLLKVLACTCCRWCALSAYSHVC
jgi:hypothetical protein